MRSQFLFFTLSTLLTLTACNPAEKSKTGDDDNNPNNKTTNGTPGVVEPTPFKNEGLNKVGRFSKKEIELTAVRFLGSERGRVGRVCKWEVDYKFVGDGFQASSLSDAYELHVRSSSADRNGFPPERGWKIHHQGNKGRFQPSEGKPAMMQPQGTVTVTWLVDPKTLKHPHVFWVYRTEPKSDDGYLRVSNFAGTKAK